jgi:hypothetical protein
MARPTRAPSLSYVGVHQYFLTTCVRDRRRVFAEPPLGLVRFGSGATTTACSGGDDVRAVRYVLHNLVRARLVATPAGYPWLGSLRYSIAELRAHAGE